MNDVIQDIDTILQGLNRNTRRKKQITLDEWMDKNENLFKYLSESVDEKEQVEVSFLISSQTQKMLEVVLKKYGNYKSSQMVKILFIYSLCLFFNTDDKRKKVFNMTKQGEII